MRPWRRGTRWGDALHRPSAPGGQAQAGCAAASMRRAHCADTCPAMPCPLPTARLATGGESNRVRVVDGFLGLWWLKLCCVRHLIILLRPGAETSDSQCVLGSLQRIFLVYRCEDLSPTTTTSLTPTPLASAHARFQTRHHQSRTNRRQREDCVAPQRPAARRMASATLVADCSSAN